MGSMIEVFVKQAMKTQPLLQHKLKLAEQWDNHIN